MANQTSNQSSNQSTFEVIREYNKGYNSHKLIFDTVENVYKMLKGEMITGIYSHDSRELALKRWSNILLQDYTIADYYNHLIKAVARNKAIKQYKVHLEQCGKAQRTSYQTLNDFITIYEHKYKQYPDEIAFNQVMNDDGLSEPQVKMIWSYYWKQSNGLTA